MKQARRWLLLAAAFVLLPQRRTPQKKKPKPRRARAAAPAAAREPRRIAPAAPAAPADADADQPAPLPPRPQPAETDGHGAPAAATSGGMDICQITPDAPQCPAAKEINLGDEAKKTVHAEVYAVQQQYVIKAHRFEIKPYFVGHAERPVRQPRRPGPRAQLLHHAGARGRRQRQLVRRR